MSIKISGNSQIKTAQGTTTLVQISDLHFGPGYRPDIARAVRESILALAPELLIVSGDLTHRATTSQFLAVRDWLDTMPFNRFVIPGNHDIPLHNVPNRLRDPFDKYRQIIGPTEPVYHSATLSVGALNSVRATSMQAGRLSLSQVKRLAVHYEQASPLACRIAVAHHHFIPPPGRDKKLPFENRIALLMALYELNIELVLCGHTHQAYSGNLLDFNDIPGAGMVICQAAGSVSVPREHRSYERIGFNHIEIDPEYITINTHIWQNTPGAFRLSGSHRFPRQEKLSEIRT